MKGNGFGEQMTLHHHKGDTYFEHLHPIESAWERHSTSKQLSVILNLVLTNFPRLDHTHRKAYGSLISMT